jgi:serine/threonine-protein kinase RsbW
VNETLDGRVVALSIPAKAEYLSVCRLALAGLSQLHPLEPETLADIKLALTEACSNSIRHAYREGREGEVEIRYELDGARLTVEVRDEGGGFSEDGSLTSAGELDEGGLGLAIIRAVTDELAIESHEGGSRLRFVKYLD